MQPLEGIRVLDLTSMLPGPFCTMVLGDMGAEVISIGRFESGRQGPGDQPPAARDRLRAFSMLDRNKKSIRINLRAAQGREVFYRLARSADVAVEGSRPGVAKRLGIDYETLAALNPRLVYCSITGYGQDGPYAQVPGHDPNYLAVSGITGLTGTAQGEFVPPAWPNSDFAVGGLQSAIGILCALMARERTGRGQFVDIAMTDGMVLFLAARFGAAYFAEGTRPVRGHRLAEVYECKDGKHINLCAVEPWFWERLCRALGLEHFVSYHEHMLPFAAPSPQRDEVVAAFQARFKTKTRDEWVELLWGADTCAAPVLGIEEVFSDPHLLHRKMIVDVDDSETGPVKMGGISIKLSDTPGTIRSLAPDPGQHTDELLSQLGYTRNVIADLRKAEAVA